MQLRIMKASNRRVLATAQESAEQVSELVNDAARDVTFYMSKAPIFEYTLLNSGYVDCCYHDCGIYYEFRLLI
jgi:hypothetical protein